MTQAQKAEPQTAEMKAKATKESEAKAAAEKAAQRAAAAEMEAARRAAERAERLAAEQADELLERFEGLTHVDMPPCKQDQASTSLASPPEAASSSPAETSDDCVVCMAAPKTHALVPCGHQCVCIRCAPTIQGMPCPICREVVVGFCRVFS